MFKLCQVWLIGLLLGVYTFLFLCLPQACPSFLSGLRPPGSAPGLQPSAPPPSVGSAAVLLGDLPSSGSPVFTPTGRLLRDVPGSEFPVVSPLGHLGDVFGSHGPLRCCRDLRPPREEAQGAVPVSVTLTSASGFRWCPPRFLPPVGHPLPFTVHRSLVGRPWRRGERWTWLRAHGPQPRPTELLEG